MIGIWIFRSLNPIFPTIDSDESGETTSSDDDDAENAGRRVTFNEEEEEDSFVRFEAASKRVPEEAEASAGAGENSPPPSPMRAKKVEIREPIQ